MPYIREWMTLAAALEQLKAAGITERQGMLDIAGALADRAVRFRVHCTNGRVIAGSDVEIPPLLTPNDLCWGSSRPLGRWYRRETVADSYFDNDLWIAVQLIELRRESVSSLLAGDSTLSAGIISEPVANQQPPDAKAGNGCSKPKPTNPALRKWMRDRVLAWPVDQPQPSEPADWKAALEYFAPDLTREEFRAVRKEETPPSWRKQGPRRSALQVKK